MSHIHRSCMFNWMRDSQIFSQVTQPVAFSPAMNENAIAASHMQAFGVVSVLHLVLHFSHLDRYVLVFPCFNLHFPDNMW